MRLPCDIRVTCNAICRLMPPDHIQWTNLNDGAYTVRVNRRSVRNVNGPAIAQHNIV
jgi:hypothetical protein